jgi:hypothetical protein
MDRLIVKIACFLLLGGVLLGTLYETASSQSVADATLPIAPETPRAATVPRGVSVAVGAPNDLLGALLLGTLWKNGPATAATTPARAVRSGGTPVAMEQSAPE